MSRAGDQPVTHRRQRLQPRRHPEPAVGPDAKGRYPAIVMIGGSGPTDRDETVAGIPIFAQIAGALADAGYYVLRYDKRGVGQSGGRAEGARADDYTEDVNGRGAVPARAEGRRREAICGVRPQRRRLVGSCGAAETKTSRRS